MEMGEKLKITWGATAPFGSASKLTELNNKLLGFDIPNTSLPPYRISAKMIPILLLRIPDSKHPRYVTLK